MENRGPRATRVDLPLAAALLALTLLTATPLVAQAPATLPFERTEKVETCTDYDPLKQPFFGETHVHTLSGGTQTSSGAY